jgi:hypothetical protein
MIFFDTETCGFHGPIVIIQWAEDDGPIHIHEVWRQPISETLELIERFCEGDVCGFNLAFDWFHLVQTYTALVEFLNKGGDPNSLPEDHIDELAECEEAARNLDLTVKPKRAMDLMLHARRGPYQTLMGRADIKIKNIPNILARPLCEQLEKRIQIDDIFFAGRKSGLRDRWQVVDKKQSPDLKDVVMKFKASGALKNLAQHALKVDKSKILRHGDISIEKEFYPIEYGFAPFALAISNAKRGWRGKIKRKGQFVEGKCWPGVIRQHINHWAFNQLARQYGQDDVVYTRDLWKFFGKPEPGDDDSELACCVGCVRWRGYKVNLDAIREERQKAIDKLKQIPTSSAAALRYITEPMSQLDKVGFGTLTGKVILEKMVKDENWRCDCTIDTGKADPTCECCKGAGLLLPAVRAQEVLGARFARKEIELYDKILLAGRLHASFVVIGALSSRMSGADGLNAQGVKRTKNVRRCFEFSYDGFSLLGGDFDAFEVVLADAAYDGALRADLTTLYPCYNCQATGSVTNKKGEIEVCEDCNGTKEAPKKIHGLFAMEMYDKTYEQVMETKGKSPDLYSLGKNGVFTMIYGGDWGTLVRKYGVQESNAKRAFTVFINKRPGLKKGQQKIVDDFGSMKQPGGLGTKVEWQDPKEYVESLFGDRRYFTLENQISKALFDLANRPPQGWRDIKIKVVRRIDRGPQFVAGATASALYGAAFGIQGSVVRAATNHVIQSSGARTTKRVQRRIWDLQPHGAHPIRVLPCNIHDEVLCPTKPPYEEAVKQVVYETIESFRPRVPLIKMEFKKMRNWAEK